MTPKVASLGHKVTVTFVTKGSRVSLPAASGEPGWTRQEVAEDGFLVEFSYKSEGVSVFVGDATVRKARRAGKGK